MNTRRRVHLEPSAFVADPQLLGALEERSVQIVCSEQQVLFIQGEEPQGLYILRSGSATLSITSESGERIELSRVSAGSLLGLPGLIGNQPCSLTAEASPGAVLGFIPREEFSALMRADPALSLRVLAVLASEVQSARRAIAGL